MKVARVGLSFDKGRNRSVFGYCEDKVEWISVLFWLRVCIQKNYLSHMEREERVFDKRREGMSLEGVSCVIPV